MVEMFDPADPIEPPATADLIGLIESPVSAGRTGLAEPSVMAGRTGLAEPSVMAGRTGLAEPSVTADPVEPSVPVMPQKHRLLSLPAPHLLDPQASLRSLPEEYL